MVKNCTTLWRSPLRAEARFCSWITSLLKVRRRAPAKSGAQIRILQVNPVDTSGDTGGWYLLVSFHPTGKEITVSYLSQGDLLLPIQQRRVGAERALFLFFLFGQTLLF